MNQQSQQGMAEVRRRLDAGTPTQRVAAALLRDDAQSAAQLAASSSDLNAYRLAIRACRKDAAFRGFVALHNASRPALAASGASVPELSAPGTEPTACAALSLERLEAADPGDAWPWLLRLADSRDRGDAAGVSQALYQIAQRSRVSMSGRPFSEVVLEVVGDEPSLTEVMALVTAIGVDAAGTLDGSVAQINSVCRAADLRDANRRQLCEQTVQRMPGMTKNLLEASMLYSLEERLGLTHSPQALSQEAAQRVNQAIADDGSNETNRLSCAGIKRMGQHIAMLTRQGELAYARARLKAASASAPR